MTDKLIIDLFAGGGGASMGIEMALGRSPDIAINHDAVAIAMHAVNHPDTEHYCSDIWADDPMTVRPGVPVGLIWASPDCKHFSKAKGGKPKDRNIRDLAWVAVDWAEKRKPDVIVIENVEEFRTWGPLDNEGNAIPEFAGQTFEDWVNRLKRAGYKVDWRESRACDYGAPTIRKRLCIIASRLGRPVWPKPTHGDPASDAVKAGRLEPWRTAADDVIDWSLPCPSIFDTKEQILEKFGLRAVRPLAHNTGARVARGIRRYVLDASTPFIVDVAHSSVSPDGKVKRWGPGIKTPDAPMGSVTAGGISQAVVSPVLTYAQQGGRSRGADQPHHTVTASDKDQNQLLAASLVQMGYGEREGQAPRALDPNDPLGTVVAGGVKHAVAAATLVGCGGRAGQSRPRGLDEPTATTTAKADACIATAFLAQHNNDSRREGGVNPGRPADAPVSTITATGAQQGIVSARMLYLKGEARRDGGADEPARTVCAEGTHAALVSGALVKYYGTGDGQDIAEALHTVTVKDRFGLAGIALAAPRFGPQHEARAREVAAFMREHGQWDGGEFVTLEVAGITLIIADVGLRMLTPRELFNAQGFPRGYQIERDAHGTAFSKSDQVGRAGNSVSPPWAAAHVAANCEHLMPMREAAE